MKYLTPFKVAVCLSLMIHGGIVGGYYAYRHQSDAAQAQLDPALEIVVMDEPVEVPEPIRASTAEVPKSATQPVPVLVSQEIEKVAPKTAAVVLSLPIETVQVPPPVPVMPLNVPEMQPVSAPEKPVVAATIVPAPADTGTPASYLFNPHPAYPKECRRHKQEGLVVLAVLVSREGLPGAINIVRSSKVPLLDEAAVNAIAHWRFSPAKIAGAAVVSQIEVPIRFKLSNRK